MKQEDSSLWMNLVILTYSTLFSGKRRALIPPSVGYINETLKPIPEEVPDLTRHIFLTKNK